ncbi:hypothetical protein [Thalassospira alkalitolerans]|uniref:Uncharacterized protein n=1 Tax=Thalassospira alkalitolerans TaxID=1293890 RepID=A0A1Y2L9I2_9PROT|nr:hypothetical protein [Thalassospira alkalitolerans]OSQ46902.1 hypothetical protein TALK_15125 [Thalassospira alkalitolerans]|tara:strand:+ start:109611 stop:109835 length:225 start_codon:yes stop_codon:yes gene_type:complete
MTPPRKLTERAFTLALVAFFAWIPPLVGVFSLKGSIFGLPILFIYFFAGWAFLIGCCALINRALRHSIQTEETD